MLGLTVVAWYGVLDARAEVPSVDWFGMQVGAGARVWLPGHGDARLSEGDGDLVLQADIHLIALKWPSAYLVPIDLHAAALVGTLGGGVRGGWRTTFGSREASEVRLGMGLGGDLVASPLETDGMAALSLRPHAQYLFSTNHGSVGIGIDAALLIALGDHGTQFSIKKGTTVVLTSLYLVWYVGSAP